MTLNSRSTVAVVTSSPALPMPPNFPPPTYDECHDTDDGDRKTPS